MRAYCQINDGCRIVQIIIGRVDTNSDTTPISSCAFHDFKLCTLVLPPFYNGCQTTIFKMVVLDQGPDGVSLCHHQSLLKTKLIYCSGAVVAVGGPAFTMWLTPTEEELRSRYNPELRKKSLENREERQQEFDDFVTRLKEYSKSDKPSVFVSSSKYQLLT